MPRLWSETLEEHRRDVGDAILTATWGLVRDRGIFAVTMSQIAEETGIGRATLYKYFPDVETILRACHRRQVHAHLDHLVAIRNGDGDPTAKVQAFLRALADIARHRARHGGPELTAALHRLDDVSAAEQEVVDLLSDLLAEACVAGTLRADVSHAELAAYCLHASTAAGGLDSEDGVDRLVEVMMAGLRPPAAQPAGTRSRRRQR